MRNFAILLISFFSICRSEATLIYSSKEDQFDQVKVIKAAPDVFTDLFKNLEKMHSPFKYLQEAAPKLRAVVFKKLPEDTYGAYNPILDTMYFPLEMQDGTSGKLLPFAKLSDSKIGAIYHEMWHAYLDLVAGPAQNELYKYFISQTQTIYTSHGRDFHDEAYGMFIYELFINYAQLWKIFTRETPETREKLRNSASMKSIYESSFHSQIFGYYYSMLQRRFIDSTVNLPESDRKKIVNLVLRDRPPYDYQEAFPEIFFAQE